IEVRKLVRITWAYSPRKNRANFIELYSVWKPPTSSCSHSDRSKGKRFASARALVKKIKQASGCVQKYQPQKPPAACCVKSVLTSSVLPNKAMPSTDIPSGIS